MFSLFFSSSSSPRFLFFQHGRLISKRDEYQARCGAGVFGYHRMYIQIAPKTMNEMAMS